MAQNVNRNFIFEKNQAFLKKNFLTKTHSPTGEMATETNIFYQKTLKKAIKSSARLKAAANFQEQSVQQKANSVLCTFGVTPHFCIVKQSKATADDEQHPSLTNRFCHFS